MAISIARIGGATAAVGGLAAWANSVQVDDLQAVKVFGFGVLVALIGTGIWASRHDGVGVEIGEGAFDGLVAMMGRGIAIDTFTPTPPVGPAVAGQIYNNGHEAGLAGSLAEALGR